MRILWGLLFLSACKPEITGDTYYCGPEGLCPPHLACQTGLTESFAFNCVLPDEVRSFQCSEETSDLEPDNSPGEGRDLGALECGGQIAFEAWGCIADGEDIDHYRVRRDDFCGGAAPRWRVHLRYPLGVVPLAIELLDEDEQIVAAGEVCTDPFDTSGTELRCIEEADLPVGNYRVRVRIDDEANADCDGACRFNHYQLFISSPIS